MNQFLTTKDNNFDLVKNFANDYRNFVNSLLGSQPVIDLQSEDILPLEELKHAIEVYQQAAVTILHKFVFIVSRNAARYVDIIPLGIFAVNCKTLKIQFSTDSNERSQTLLQKIALHMHNRCVAVEEKYEALNTSIQQQVETPEAYHEFSKHFKECQSQLRFLEEQFNNIKVDKHNPC